MFDSVSLKPLVKALSLPEASSIHSQFVSVTMIYVSNTTIGRIQRTRQSWRKRQDEEFFFLPFHQLNETVILVSIYFFICLFLATISARARVFPLGESEEKEFTEIHKSYSSFLCVFACLGIIII